LFFFVYPSMLVCLLSFYVRLCVCVAWCVFSLSLSYRLKQFSGDLLAACIEMVLGMPIEFIELPMLVPALLTAFKLGVTYTPLAVTGIQTLEYWLKEMLPNLKSHLPSILPVLSEYLHVDQTSLQEKKSLNMKVRVLQLLGKLGGDSAHLLGSVDLTEVGFLFFAGVFCWEVCVCLFRCLWLRGFSSV
jgi:DNA-PKcs, N-terminal